MRVLICGSRLWDKPAPIGWVLHGIVGHYGSDAVTVIHGAARGADTMAGEIASTLGCNVEVFPADWDTHGRGAGHIRNAQMLADGKPDLVVAFTNNLLESRGTKNMVDRAKAAGVPVYVMGRA